LNGYSEGTAQVWYAGKVEFVQEKDGTRRAGSAYDQRKGNCGQTSVAAVHRNTGAKSISM
jgi:hypothetical protein